MASADYSSKASPPQLKTLDFSKGIPFELIPFADRNFHSFFSDCDDFYIRLSQNKEKLVSWNVSNLASRHNSDSELFDQLFNLEIILKYISSVCLPHSIILSSSEVLPSLKSYFSQKGLTIQIQSPKLKRNIIYVLLGPKLKFLLKYLRFLFRFILLWHRRKKAAKIIPKLSAQSKVLLLVDTYILLDRIAMTFASGDHYYKNFDRVLTKKELANTYIIFTVAENTELWGAEKWKRLYTEMSRSPLNFMPKESYLNIFDLLYLLLHPWRLKRIQLPQIYYKGIDMSSFVSHLRDKELFSMKTIEAVLNYRFIRRLAKKKIQITSFLDWYENQCYDKGLHLAFNKFYHQSVSLACMGYSFLPYLYGIRLLDVDQKAGLLPKKFWVSGETSMEYAKSLIPSCDMLVNGALRFSIPSSTEIAEAGSRNIVLLALPYHGRDLEHTISIILLLQGFLFSFFEKYKLMLRIHPASPHGEREYLRQYVEISNGEVQDLLKETVVLIGCGSSICLEALAQHIPVMIMGGTNSYTLNMIPKDTSSEIYSVCYKTREYLERLQYYLSPEFAKLKEGKLYQDFEYVRSKSFAPFDKNKIRETLNLRKQD